MSAQTIELCDVCGLSPVAYRVDGDAHEKRCEPCAIRYGYERRGEAYVAMETLGFAISLLRAADVDDSAISGMVHEILAAPHSVGEYAIGGGGFLPGRDRDRVEERPWMTGLSPLEAA